jgi:5,6-dimethylbenzimidazole synthase
LEAHCAVIHPAHSFSSEDREALNRIIEARRDMRHFVSNATIDEAVLHRLLQAAHSSPSVGLMQPWRFIRICDPSLRTRVAALVDEERLATASALDERRAHFLELKVEGIRECAELIAVVLAPDDGTVFGRRTMPEEMAICSAACAIQNLWLAARAENLGMGWVSMFKPDSLAHLLDLPQGAKPLALLCLGPVPEFYDQPMLERDGWRYGRDLKEFVFRDRWNGK